MQYLKYSVVGLVTANGGCSDDNGLDKNGHKVQLRGSLFAKKNDKPYLGSFDDQPSPLTEIEKILALPQNTGHLNQEPVELSLEEDPVDVKKTEEEVPYHNGLFHLAIIKTGQYYNSQKAQDARSSAKKSILTSVKNVSTFFKKKNNE